MLRLITVSVVATLTASCFAPDTVTYAYKPGATVAQKDQDNFECRLAATKQVPINTQIATTPTYRTPTETRCDGFSCVTTGGQTLGGQTYSVDANAQIRSEYYGRCLAAKGYTFYPVTPCPKNSVPTELHPLITGRLREPSEGACLAILSSRAGNIVYPSERNK